MNTRLLAAACALPALIACADDTPVTTAPQSLDALQLFEDAVAQTPAEGVIPYDVNAILYADESYKLRFLKIPEGQSATYNDNGLWDYPVGTLFIKTFYFPLDEHDPDGDRRLLETRIIERDADKWTGRTYVWNDEQTEAIRKKAGTRVPVEWTDHTGTERSLDYRVPNDNECKTCHSVDREFEPLGPRTRQLNRDHDYGTAESPSIDNQIDHLVALNALTGDIPAASERVSLSDPYGTDDLDRRARSYFDVNCSHCHRPGGEASSSGLDLRFENTDPMSYGICKTPVAAGPGSGNRTHDIVPGDPDASILVYRMESIDPGFKMPELPTITSDTNGVALIREWITAMPQDGCP